MWLPVLGMFTGLIVMNLLNKILVAVVGGVLLILGVAMLLLPGPAIVLIPAALAILERAHRRVRAKVPPADESCDVAGGFETLGDGRFGQRHAVRAGRIELVAETRLVAAREQGGARRRTIRPGDVSAREAHARCRQRVKVRRGDLLAAVEPHVGVTHVIADDEKDVGFGGGQSFSRAELRNCSAQPPENGGEEASALTWMKAGSAAVMAARFTVTSMALSPHSRLPKEPVTARRGV